MGAKAAATLSRLVTRHVLFMTTEGLSSLAPLGGGAVAFSKGCLALRCRGSEMLATVTVERHEGRPDESAAPWAVVVTGSWELTSGHLALTDIDGLLEWFPELGLAAGRWNVRVSTAGGDDAEQLEDGLLERLDDPGSQDDGDVLEGPERWLVQFWR
jgi:hypothetical protein